MIKNQVRTFYRMSLLRFLKLPRLLTQVLSSATTGNASNSQEKNTNSDLKVTAVEKPCISTQADVKIGWLTFCRDFFCFATIRIFAGGAIVNPLRTGLILWLGNNLSSHRDKIVVNTNFISNKAKAEPIQRRLPPPNGKYS